MTHSLEKQILTDSFEKITTLVHSLCCFVSSCRFSNSKMFIIKFFKPLSPPWDKYLHKHRLHASKSFPQIYGLFFFLEIYTFSMQCIYASVMMKQVLTLDHNIFNGIWKKKKMTKRLVYVLWKVSFRRSHMFKESFTMNEYTDGHSECIRAWSWAWSLYNLPLWIFQSQTGVQAT